ncbi:CWF19-like protein 2 isoform X2 [Dinothrombium tinctorium]|uniref:CWF19-like protein 2 isoform X2 n=1 Tax=Dinothrombium tinctorium TaxID=1965070 RepID=A0A443R468_9ACAR|nr:CWF19-like protein 2 isoform X2 [Dinothrombium tinctorium]
MKAELMGNKELVERLKRQLAECDRSDGGENEKQSGDRSSNVKCVTIAQKVKDENLSLKQMVPNGLSYFWVTFGDSNIGFAHVIEDERRFPKYFGQEVIGGLLDIEPMKWRSKNKQTFEQQLQRITDVKSLWKKLKRD